MRRCSVIASRCRAARRDACSACPVARRRPPRRRRRRRRPRRRRPRRPRTTPPSTTRRRPPPTPAGPEHPPTSSRRSSTSTPTRCATTRARRSTGNASCCATTRASNVTIEGHCDERGTVEYNQALGERRAQAARDYLVAAGIDAGRACKSISYGKERPFDPGHDESAWAQEPPRSLRRFDESSANRSRAAALPRRRGRIPPGGRGALPWQWSSPLPARAAIRLR